MMNERITKMSLVEYKEEVKNFWKEVEGKLLVDAKDNEVYQVYNICKNDFLKYNLEYSGVFKQIKSIHDMIYRAWENSLSLEDIIEEDLDDICYWVIKKYRILLNGEYEEIFCLSQTSSNKYLDFEFNYKIQSFGNQDETFLYKKWIFLNSARWIDFDFRCGDIIQVNAKPMYEEYNEFFVYYEDDGVFKRDSFGTLRYGSISRSSSQYGYRCFVPFHIKKIESCDDEVMNKLSKIVSENNDKKNKKILNALMIREKDSIFADLDRAKELEERIKAGEDISDIYN